MVSKDKFILLYLFSIVKTKSFIFLFIFSQSEEGKENIIFLVGLYP